MDFLSWRNTLRLLSNPSPIECRYMFRWQNTGPYNSFYSFCLPGMFIASRVQPIGVRCEICFADYVTGMRWQVQYCLTQFISNARLMTTDTCIRRGWSCWVTSWSRLRSTGRRDRGSSSLDQSTMHNHTTYRHRPPQSLYTRPPCCHGSTNAKEKYG